LLAGLFLASYAKLKTNEYLSKETLLFCQVCKANKDKEQNKKESEYSHAVGVQSGEGVHIKEK
jgi:hypothetical protein